MRKKVICKTCKKNINYKEKAPISKIKYCSDCQKIKHKEAKKRYKEKIKDKKDLDLFYGKKRNRKHIPKEVHVGNRIYIMDRVE